MSHALNIIEKTDINKSIISLIEKSKYQNSKIKIRKNEIIVNLENESKFIFYSNSKTLLKIENKNHSSYNKNTELTNFRKELNSISNPLGLEKSLTPSITDIKKVNKKIKIKEVQLSISRKKSRLILNKIN